GLHPRDNARLLAALRHLRDLGNTLVLVEHDREVIEAADHLVDFGPGSGGGGGQVTAAGPPAKVKASKRSLTGQYLSGEAAIPVPTDRRPADGPALVIRGARHHNLKDLDVAIPLGVATVVTGVSGSGKSSLIEDILWKAAARALHRAQVTPGAHEAIEGLERIDKVIRVDQTPLGSTPTSTPGTYSGAFDLIRELFAKLPEAKVRGYTARRFSFNQPGGRCEACEGAGQKRIEMHFLPDVWVTCESCGGSRYTPETLAVKFRGKTVADVLDMPVEAALALFASVPKIRRVLQTLHDVGLGYIPLGQAAPTLSGGEAQRVKLAAELARPDTGKTLYLLDEPTTGLHFDDIRKLLNVVHRLADLGNTVVIIEHNLEVIKTADWIIDLGPDAGAAGGEVVAAGPPERIAAAKRSLTGAILKGVLAAGPRAERPRFDPKAAAQRALAEVRAAPPDELAHDIKPPWEIDGRRWHTRDRVGRSGRPARWDGRILERVVDRIHELGDFAPTDWSQRTSVRIAGPNPGDPTFFQAMTGHEWVASLRFTVPRNTFQAASLENQLRLTPFHEAATPVLSDSQRLTVADGKGPTQDVTITCYAVEDLETPAFDAFLAKAVAAFRRIGKTGALITASELP
ncbi:MAG TPA: excinuclease ABC subunit A, partial [Isosphaeraceae bacterium]|nr:excinuclease ABC subunit A [Isosphaeraceae bacterium]